MNSREKMFIDSITQLVNKKCWSVYGCDSAGTTISLDFGKKVRRKKPISNKVRSRTEKYFMGEFALLIFCSWRIDSKTKVLISSREENGGRYLIGGPTLKTLKRLVGKKVIAIQVLPPGFDLIIEFERGLMLKVFCDNTGKVNDYNENYVFYSDGKLPQTVDVKGRIFVGK